MLHRASTCEMTFAYRPSDVETSDVPENSPPDCAKASQSFIYPANDLDLVYKSIESTHQTLRLQDDAARRHGAKLRNQVHEQHRKIAILFLPGLSANVAQNCQAKSRYCRRV